MFAYIRHSAVLGAASLLGCAAPSLPGLGGTPPTMVEKPSAELTKLAGKTKEPELPPDKAGRLCLAAADELEKGGHYAHAIAECELAREHTPNLPGLSRKLAGLYARQGDFEKAIAEYRKELSKNAKDADLLNDVGFCYYQMKDYANAEKYLRQAVTLKPQLQRAHTNLGLALGRQEKWREAMEEFKKAGSAAAAHANLAAMYHAAGRDDDAQRECKIALNMDPQLKTASDLLAKLEETTKEQQAVQQAEARMPAPTTPPVVQVTEPAPDAGAIKLKRPVVTKREEPTFKPVR